MGTETPPPEAKASLPHSWLFVLGGLVVFVAAGAYCAFVIRHYLATVPINLCEYADSCVVQFDEVLTSNQILGDDVSRSGPELHVDTNASWHSYVYEITVPETINADGLASLIGRKMLRYSVSTIEKSRADNLVELSLGIGPYEIAVVRLHAQPGKSDLVASCNAVADTVYQTLQGGASGGGQVVRSQAEPKQEGPTSWSYTRFEIVLAQEETIETLQGRVEQAVAGHGARVRIQAGAQDTRSLMVSLDGVDCVEIVARRQDATPVLPGPTGAGLMPGASDDIESAMSSLFDIEDLPLDSNGLVETNWFPPLDTKETPSPSVSPKVAIIVDDGGFGGAVSDKILGLNSGLTLAILPYGRAAADTAQRAKELGFEVMAHIPMEKAKDPGAFVTTMTRDEMSKALEDALSRVPGAVGVNNHMGSTFTADEAAIETFLSLVKEHPLYFVDSRTTHETKAFEAAKALGIKAGHRNVFLDNKKDPEYIRGQFMQLVEAAQKQGSAIGICHFRKNTADALTVLLPELEKKGIRLVHASELVQ